jgi:hypothetical protein
MTCLEFAPQVWVNVKVALRVLSEPTTKPERFSPRGNRPNHGPSISPPRPRAPRRSHPLQRRNNRSLPSHCQKKKTAAFTAPRTQTIPPRPGGSDQHRHALPSTHLLASVYPFVLPKRLEWHENWILNILGWPVGGFWRNVGQVILWMLL